MSDAGTEEGKPPRPDAIEVQLRIGLLLVQLLGAALFAFGLGYMFWRFSEGDPSGRAESVGVLLAFFLLPGVVLFFTARSARQRVRAHAASARLWGILSGVFALLASLPFLRLWVGPVAAFLGLFTLTAGWLFRRPEDERPATGA